MSVITTKKTALALLSCALCSPVYADTLGIYTGGGIWQASLSGEIGLNDNDNLPASMDELGIEDNQNTFIYLAFEHPIPVIPNIKVSMNNITAGGDAVITRDININQPIPDGDGLTIPANSNTLTEIDLSHIDYTLYYELLDNYVSLDIGLNARAFDSSAKITYDTVPIDDEPSINGEEEIKLDEILPMLYGKVQLDLPFTGWYVGGSANYISYEKNSVTDGEVKVGYMTSGLGLDVGFDLGYRSFSLQVEDSDNDLDADVTLSGVYASLNVHF